MPLSPDAAARLRSETFVRAVEVHGELGSTNDRALELVGGPEGAAIDRPAVILAERQTAGRGRGSNRWAAPPGGLTFTLLLDRPTPRSASESVGEEVNATLLAPLTGLVVAEVAAALTDAEVGVKWPNDVLLRAAPDAPWGKLAGVLCEAAPTGEIAVGIGLNLNSDPAAFPSDLPRPAASLRRDSAAHDPVTVLIDLLVRLETEIEALADGGRLDPTRWASRDVLAGRSVSILGGSPVTGTACGVAPDGALRVFDGQTVREIRSGTVEWSSGQSPPPVA
ncbi:biotin--[acetyl-CoA-carboxylase] ligase [Alienimonas chondri]|uniref:Bifunctional ligase/repressor BirA n=1 Tax=Alienimonas chondri TaxID=2681879 RepID=A0ABX1VCI2_9PLAN|nr:biotin--[acetyl-CoA-carboxylase] ligase [Alienimonas chondri]NNJ25842.1 Bifunctional ligase/repressor BirA [Alienimonas chondri]